MGLETNSNFQLRLKQCNQLLESANEHLKQDQFNEAITEYTRIIMFAPNWENEADKSGVPTELRGIFIAALQTAYVGRSMSYLAIGEKEKYELDSKMSRELSRLSSVKYSPKKNAAEDDEGDSIWSWIIGVIGAVLSILYHLS